MVYSKQGRNGNKLLRSAQRPQFWTDMKMIPIAPFLVYFGYLAKETREWALKKLYAIHLPMPSWEKTNENYCTKTIADLGEQTDLVAQSKKFNPMVNAILDYLKTNKYFKCPSVLTC